MPAMKASLGNGTRKETFEGGTVKDRYRWNIYIERERDEVDRFIYV